MQVRKFKLDKFTIAYIVAALWSTNDNSTPQGGDPLDQNYGIPDFSDEALERIQKDCARFQAEHEALLNQAYEYRSYGYANAGHDFWLTRCGHGTGFWDRGLGKIGEALTDASKVFGNQDIYVGDNGKLYLG